MSQVTRDHIAHALRLYAERLDKLDPEGDGGPSLRNLADGFEHGDYLTKEEVAERYVLKEKNHAD